MVSLQCSFQGVLRTQHADNRFQTKLSVTHQQCRHPFSVLLLLGGFCLLAWAGSVANSSHGCAITQVHKKTFTESWPWTEEIAMSAGKLTWFEHHARIQGHSGKNSAAPFGASENENAFLCKQWFLNLFGEVPLYCSNTALDRDPTSDKRINAMLKITTSHILTIILGNNKNFVTSYLCPTFFSSHSLHLISCPFKPTPMPPQ